jgi:hypothetical protein
MNLDSNMLLGIFVIIILVAVIYYLNQNNQQPVPNDGAIINFADSQYGSQTTTDNRIPYNTQTGAPLADRPVRPPNLDNRRADEISGDLVANIVSQYTVEDRPMDGQGVGTFTASDPMSDTHGPFNNYGHKRQLNMEKMEQPYSPDSYNDRDFSYRLHRLRKQRGTPDTEEDMGTDNRDFVHKRQKYSKRMPSDIKDQFDVNKMLPNEIEQDWFDVEPLLTTKKIKGTHLLHPKVHMGVNTVGSSLRNGTHDLRGDIPNPKIYVSPWLNSTIEPDTNIKGICNPI